MTPRAISVSVRAIRVRRRAHGVQNRLSLINCHGERLTVEPH
ncbi:MAG: hypothetical protein OXH22_06375 [Chloroflexi bacterium]|nr:hypothetical protein [Chloroflexota bacterium]